MFISKGVGIFLAGLITTLAGLPTNAKPGAIDDNILINVALFFVPIYMILYLFSIYFFSLYKIDQDTHESNLALINKR